MRRPVEWVAASSLRTFLVLFLLAFGLRLALLQFMPPEVIPPNPAWETGAVSLSLARGDGFADPYLIPTGPTAHVPPLLVSAESLLYRLLGTRYRGGLARWILVMVVYATLWASLPWLGGQVGVGREAGVIGGFLGALAVGFPSELEPYSAVALLLLLAAFSRRWQAPEPPTRGSFLLGLAAGVAFHLQPALLPVVLGWVVFELFWGRHRRKWSSAGLLVLGVVMACLPWGMRNYRAFHEVFFIRSNLGLELYMGYHDRVHADMDISTARRSYRHPRTDLEEAERVRAMGEAAYMRSKQQEAFAWIRDNPGEAVRLTATRALYFWAGPLHRPDRAIWYSLVLLFALVGAWGIVPGMEPPQRAALLIPLVSYPLVYYAVAYMPRYGEPVRWILFLFAGSALWGWVKGPLERPNPEGLPGGQGNRCRGRS